MFRLAKWYLDLVTEEGTVLIVYAAALTWASLRATCTSTFLARPGEAPLERSAWAGVVLPEGTGDMIRFAHEELGLTGRWHRAADPVDVTLLADAAGSIEWECLHPNATAQAVVDGASLTGRGYAERLTMTVPPWTLPFRRLRWGRFTGSSRSAAWIAWEGASSRRWTWLDSAPQPEATLEADGIRQLGSPGMGGFLHLAPARELLNRQALQVFSRRMPVLRALPLGPFGNLREIKYLARGSLHHHGATVDEGWVIHEEVTW